MLPPVPKQFLLLIPGAAGGHTPHGYATDNVLPPEHLLTFLPLILLLLILILLLLTSRRDTFRPNQPLHQSSAKRELRTLLKILCLQNIFGHVKRTLPSIVP